MAIVDFVLLYSSVNKGEEGDILIMNCFTSWAVHTVGSEKIDY